MKKIITVFLAVTFILCVSNFNLVFAQERGDSAKNRMLKRAILFELLSEGDKKELIALRREYMEKFREAARKKLEVKKEELLRLERENPEEFKKATRQAHERMKQRIVQLREKNPQKFEEMKKRRLARIKRELRYIKETDPAQYEEIIKKIEEMKRQALP